MGISLRPEHLARYKDIGRLLVKYGRSDLVKEAGMEAVFRDEAPEEGAAPPEAEELARDLERLGPTYIKLGQLLSTRADLLPLPYLTALARLQDEVEPFPYEEAEAIVSAELGVRATRAFRSFERVPLAAASLGQVHRAELRDGRRVAVKVQRPGIREKIFDDLAALEEAAELLDRHGELGRVYDLTGMLDEFRRALVRELDYGQEAQNLRLLGAPLAEFDRLVVPAPVADYTTSRVLTMEYIDGRKITALSPLARLELDGAVLAEQLFRAYLKQILADGFFHADPHPGNVFITTDGRLALLDLGMVAQLSPDLQEQLLKLVLAISEGEADEAARISIRLARPRPDFDEQMFQRQITELVLRNRTATASEIELGRVVMQLARACGESGLRAPPELTMLGKALLNLDQIGRTLDPDFNPNERIRENAGELLRRRMLQSVSPGNLLSTALEMNELAQSLPDRLNRILETAARNELRLKVDAFDEVHMMEGLQKVANRIALGLVVAALIVGAAMLMHVDTPFRILGYPGLAILLFAAAALCGIGLVVIIITHDERARRDRDH
jgi:ubiquinone biosynthesis protein